MTLSFARTLFYERSGRFSAEKTLCLLFAIIPAIWLAALALQDGRGGRPVAAALHFTGLWAVRFLILGLAVTPARRALAWPKLFFARRIFGLAAMGYALLHLCLYVVDQGVAQAAREIVLRTYLSIGAVAVALLIALGATSFDGAIRRLGARRWNALHTAVYVIAPLAILHFFIQAKLDVSEPAIMGGALIFLVLYRLAFRARGAVAPVHLAGIAVVSALLTAIGEAAWYGLATRVNPWLVAEANFSFVLGPSPAWWVLAGGLLFALTAYARGRNVPARTHGRG